MGFNAYADEPGFLKGFNLSERSLLKPVTRKSLLAEIDKSEKEGGTESHIVDTNIENIVTNYDNAYCKNLVDKVYLLNVKTIIKEKNSEIIFKARFKVDKLRF